mmetsp:Transcript_12241/g.35930  ORF Transcript_12241/g.35930 Transcript_12241/m.35930 type:complete len:205 (+) Transcript_12241:14-628(+)
MTNDGPERQQPGEGRGYRPTSPIVLRVQRRRNDDAPGCIIRPNPAPSRRRRRRSHPSGFPLDPPPRPPRPVGRRGRTVGPSPSSPSSFDGRRRRRRYLGRSSLPPRVSRGLRVEEPAVHHSERRRDDGRGGGGRGRGRGSESPSTDARRLGRDDGRRGRAGRRCVFRRRRRSRHSDGGCDPRREGRLRPRRAYFRGGRRGRRRQ